MGLLDNIKQQIGSQFIEIIQWLDESEDSLVYRFPVYNQEIKMGAQLTVLPAPHGHGLCVQLAFSAECS